MKKTGKNIIKKFVSETSLKIINDEEQQPDSAELYRIITSASMDGFVAAGTDGHILDVNDAFCRMIGFGRDELLGMSIPDLDAKETPDETREHIQRFINTGADVFETELMHKDGRIVKVEVSATFSSQLGRLLVFLRDITERKRAEEAVHKANETLYVMLNSLPVAIFDLDANGVVQTIWNPAAEHMLGYTKKEALGQFLPSIQTEKAKEEFKKFREKLKSGTSIVGVDLSRHRKDGSPIEYSLYAAPLHDSQGVVTGNIAMLVDIMERKQAEEALRESEDRFRKIFEEANIGIVIVSPSFAFEKVNSAFCRMMGYSAEELSTMKFADITHPDHLMKDIENVKKVAQGEIPFYQTEKRYIHKTGKVIWGDLFVSSIRDEQGVLRYFLSMVQDITERKQAEEALRVSEEKYRDIFERAVEGIFQSSVKGKFLNINPSFASILGYESPQKLLASISNIKRQLFVKPEEADFFTSTLEKNGIILGFEHEVYRKDGSKIWISVNAHAVKDKSGKIIYYEGISENISKRRQDEEEKEKLHSQLRQAQKMEALGTFVGGIAHDFNNILSIIIGYATLLNMELKKNNPLHSYTDLILSSSEKAANLTQGLLAFSRKQSINLKQLKLNDVIKGTEKILKRLLTEDIILKKNFTKENTDIMADPTQIDQILFNLATNARDAMPKGGKLSIETKIIEMDKDFMDVTGYGNAGKFVVLSVSDSGIGIDNKNKEHIFDPFFTTKEVGKGTGLGLSTVYGIVKQHNGYINVHSELNNGTTFHIYFPSAKISGKGKKKTFPKIRHGKEKVLVAEDNEGVRSLIKRILTKYGYKIIEAVDGEDAIGKFRRNKGIDLIIIDSVMPKKNGREVYNEIIKINPGIKVLFTSGYTRDVVLDKGIEEKEFDFISKPVTPKKLLYKLGEILDRK
jgi:two-component system, cell cycle sensor histidine kinase and response regulator CckA